MKKCIVILLSFVLVLGMLSVCEGHPAAQESPSANGYKLGRIDLSVLGTPIFIAGNTLLSDLCETTGAEVVLTTLAGYDDASFMSAYEYLIDQGCDGIIVTTFSEGPISLIADIMEEAGVDWFLANRRITDPELLEKVMNMDTLVGNSYCEEEENAYNMVRQLHEDYGVKNLAVLGLTQGDLNGDLRDKGIARACEEFGVNLLTETRGIKTVDDVTNSVEGIIASYPELDSIFIVGGTVTTGALAGAAQSLANHDLSDKVSIAMIDISAGMSEYMGEGKPLKLVCGGNTIMDVLFSGASLINHAMGVDTEDEPYVIYTHMMSIRGDSTDADDYDEYVENTTIPMISGEQWYNTVIGKSLEEIQAFSDNFSVEYVKGLRN